MNETELFQKAKAWLDEDPDAVTRAELEALIAKRDVPELHERFDSRLEFGTAGLRGLLGTGPNRMNRALVRRVTAGLAEYLHRAAPEARERGVIVGRDARRMSPEFALDTAGVLAGAGIKVHVFPAEIPTPVTAFAVNALGASAGVIVTASHNPPEYNGYKVYWSNGAQIVPPHDNGISAAIDAVGPTRSIPVLSEAEARAGGLWVDVPEAVGESYLRSILELRRHPELPPDVGIVYTPLHGVGAVWVEAALRRAGFTRVWTVPEQAAPDGDFPTVRFPNPEEEGAMDLAAALAAKHQADIVLANDPDADRLAAHVRDRNGSLLPLTGNEIGTALAYYLLTERPPSGDLLVMTTIVSSSVLRRMAEGLGARYEEALTGFKWIANRAIALEESKGFRFVFGFEEALGYTVGDVVRDKDGIGAALVFADLAAFCRSRGETVMDYLETVWRRFGLYASDQKSVTLPGTAGTAAIRAIMKSFRGDPPTDFGGVAIRYRTDVQAGVRVGPTGSVKLDLPKSDVIVYELTDGSRVLLRPSGTEPKIKYYFEVAEPVAEGEPIEEASKRAKSALARLRAAFLAEAERRAPAG